MKTFMKKRVNISDSLVGWSSKYDNFV